MSIAQRYLDALGVQPSEPGLPFLAELTRAHVATLPFSSIGPRLGDDLPLDAESLLDRIVVRGRGGYCFEQNGLMLEALRELGFEARIQLARVIHNQDVHPGLTHRVTLVTVDGQDVVVDVGFGPLGPPCPVPMPGADRDDGARFRVHEERPGEFHMQSIVDGDRYSLYRFDLVRYGQSDCELGHFYSHRHPEATFVNNLVASRILDERGALAAQPRVLGDPRGRHDDDRHHERRAADGPAGRRARHPGQCGGGPAPVRRAADQLTPGTNASTGESPWGQPSRARPPGPHISVDPAHTRRWIGTTPARYLNGMVSIHN